MDCLIEDLFSTSETTLNLRESLFGSGHNLISAAETLLRLKLVPRLLLHSVQIGSGEGSNKWMSPQLMKIAP